MSRATGVQWLVRLEYGKILGPYSTQKVLQLISQGTFTGEESVATYPGGDWKPISKESDFYDRLLDALNDIEHDLGDKAANKINEDTVLTQSEKKVNSAQSKESEEDSVKVEILHSSNKDDLAEKIRQIGSSKSTSSKSQLQTNYNPKSEASEVIELEDLKQVERKKLKDAVKKPLLLVLIVLLVSIVWYLLPSEKVVSGKVSLIAPERTGVSMSPEAIRKNIQRALLNFQKDDFASYVEAQNLMVRAVEGDSKNTSVRGLLCLVYKELWPYSFQNSDDINVVNQVSQSTKALDPVGLDGITCDTIRLIINGRFKEARGIIETALSSYPTSPVLYQLKGEIIAGDRDFRTAVAYMEKATELWPTWLRSYVMQSDMYKNLGEPQKARDLLNKVIAKNTQHKRALVRMGLLEHQQFRQSTTALEYFNRALRIDEPLPRLLDAQVYLAMAQIYKTRDEKSKALQYAQQSYSLNSSNSESRQLILELGGTEKLKNTRVQDTELVYLGDQYRRQGDCFAAQAEYKAAFENDPTNGIAALKAAQCLWELSQVQESLAYLKKATRADPKLMEAYVTEADYYSQRYNFLSATRVLNRARSIQPNSHEVWRGYALMELRRKDFKASIGYANRALKIYDTDIETHLIMAQAHMGAGEYQEAFRYAAKAVELDAANAKAQTLYAKCLSYIQGIRSALHYLEDLIRKFPYVIDYRHALADIHVQDERHREALEIYQQIVDINPSNKKAHIGLGQMQQATGFMEEALKSYLTAASLDPSDAESIFLAGRLYLETGRFTIAIQQFERVLSINSLYPRVHYHIGRAALLMGDQARALAEAEKEKKVNPNLADAYLLAAEAYSAARSYSQCAGEYQRALRLRPQGAEIYVKVARCYRLSGSLDVAAAMLGLAKDKESGYAEIYKEQGALYEMQGEYISAREAYDLYLELSPNANDRVEIERKLASFGQ